MSLIDELLKDEILEAQVESVELIPGSKGRFEVTVNGKLIFSKKTLGRHAEPHEVFNLVKAKSAPTADPQF